MEQINGFKIKLNEHDKELAKEEAFNEASYIGFLGEIAAAKYLGTSWCNPGYSDTDISHNNIKYQVKTVPEDINKRRFWLENKNKDFDYYMFCVLDKEHEYVTIEGIIKKELAELNKHQINNINAIWRK